MQELSLRGVFHYFLFTKPEKALLFESLGFREVARAMPYAVLLETGVYSVEQYCREVRAATVALTPGRRAGLVVNCNPFTLGHRAVIEQACERKCGSYCFLSLARTGPCFPLPSACSLFEKGFSDLTNVVVVSAGDYSVFSGYLPCLFYPE